MSSMAGIALNPAICEGWDSNMSESAEAAKGLKGSVSAGIGKPILSTRFESRNTATPRLILFVYAAAIRLQIR